MKKIISILVLLGTVLAVVAEPVTVPKTFVAGTPAKSAEVNANFAALAGALQGLHRMALYQSTVRIGKSLLGNVILLNTNYIVMPVKQKNTSTVIIKSGVTKLYFTSTNCTGATYIEKSPSIQLANETGWVSAHRSSAFYLDAATTLTAGAFRSMLNNGGVCTEYKTQAEWGAVGACDGFVPAVPADTLMEDPNVNYTACFSNISPSQAYPVQSNSPAVTGVTTVACTSASGTPAVCLSNAELKWE